MDGASDQFLSGTRLAPNKHGGRCWRKSLHELKDAVQRLALADNLLKISLGTNLVLKVKLFLSEFVREFRYLPIGECVFNGNGYLVRDLSQEIDVFFAIGIVLSPTDSQDAGCKISAQQGQHAGRFELRCKEKVFPCSGLRQILRFANPEFAAPQYAKRQGFLSRCQFALPKTSVTGKTYRIDSQPADIVIRQTHSCKNRAHHVLDN